MTDEGKQGGGGTGLMEPVITAFRVIGMFFDVLTVMVRLLFNTLVYDTPLGKSDIGIGARDEGSTSS